MPPVNELNPRVGWLIFVAADDDDHDHVHGHDDD